MAHPFQRYPDACEDLLKVYETESAHVTPEFARKCAGHGIEHPAGTYLQDLGWPARPKVQGDHIRYTTWREYMRDFATKPRKDWQFTQEDILVTLPWGEKTIQNLRPAGPFGGEHSAGRREALRLWRMYGRAHPIPRRKCNEPGSDAVVTAP